MKRNPPLIGSKAYSKVYQTTRNFKESYPQKKVCLNKEYGKHRNGNKNRRERRAKENKKGGIFVGKKKAAEEQRKKGRYRKKGLRINVPTKPPDCACSQSLKQSTDFLFG